MKLLNGRHIIINISGDLGKTHYGQAEYCIVGERSVALWASGVLHCGRAECCIVGEQSVALWASGALPCWRAEFCIVGEPGVLHCG